MRTNRRKDALFNNNAAPTTDCSLQEVGPVLVPEAELNVPLLHCAHADRPGALAKVPVKN